MSRFAARRPPVESVRSEIRALPAFELERVPELQRRFKLDQNESPWEPPRRLKERVATELLARPWARYPEIHSEELRRALSHLHAWPVAGIVVGNGSNELLATAVETFVAPGGELLGLVPSFAAYPLYAVRAGARTRFLGPREDLASPLGELHREIAQDPRRPLLLASPNNPTGEALAPAALADLARALAAPLLLDAAYAEFCRHDYRPLLDEHPNLILFRTFSKAWALGGLRVGYLLGHPDLVREILKVKLPYNVGHAAAVAALVSLEAGEVQRRRVAAIRARRERWASMLAGFCLEVFPSEANFVLVRLPAAGEARRLHQGLLDRGILVRDVGVGPGLEGCLRITVGDGGALRAVRRALEEVLGSAPSPYPLLRPGGEGDQE